MLMGKRTCMPKEKNNLSFESITAELGMMGKKLDQAQKRLAKTELIIELQKKLSSIMGLDEPTNIGKSDAE